MSLHLLYFFQFFNMSCFLVLKYLYNCQIKKFIKGSINFIDKLNFLVFYNQACTEIYQLETFCNGFKATKLVLYNLIWVLIAN